jgi:hypothetical protein
MCGAILFDLPRAYLAMQATAGWLRVHNRSDQISYQSDPPSLRIESGVTSSLHLADTLPWFGRKLLQRVLDEWSFSLSPEVQFTETPDISVIIPHRGVERRELLEVTIRNWATFGDRVEVIVVEQDAESRLKTLPGNTRYLHLPHPVQPAAWHKCYAFNTGAQLARGRILVCHDSDLIVPSRYVREIDKNLLQRGYDVVYPQRFLFYLKQADTAALLRAGNLEQLRSCTPEMVKQNWVGGTFAIRTEAFWRVGGFDERFTGWTGEDREFYDRCQVLNGWFHGYIPFIHLWHPPQAERVSPQKRLANDALTREILKEPRESRVRQQVALRQEAAR